MLKHLILIASLAASSLFADNSEQRPKKKTEYSAFVTYGVLYPSMLAAAELASLVGGVVGGLAAISIQEPPPINLPIVLGAYTLAIPASSLMVATMGNEYFGSYHFWPTFIGSSLVAIASFAYLLVNPDKDRYANMVAIGIIGIPVGAVLGYIFGRYQEAPTESNTSISLILSPSTQGFSVLLRF